VTTNNQRIRERIHLLLVERPVYFTYPPPAGGESIETRPSSFACAPIGEAFTSDGVSGRGIRSRSVGQAWEAQVVFPPSPYGVSPEAAVRQLTQLNALYWVPDTENELPSVVGSMESAEYRMPPLTGNSDPTTLIFRFNLTEHS
jgi:hypothetical protein